jgi:hypothetical protein
MTNVISLLFALEKKGQSLLEWREGVGQDCNFLF